MNPFQQIQELGSEQLGEIAHRLWGGYLIAAAGIQRNQNIALYHNRRIIASIEDLYHQQDSRFQARRITYQLKNDLSRPLVLPAFSYSSVLQKSRFPCEFSAAYHPFKHQDVSQNFFGNDHSPTPLEEYLSWGDQEFAKHAHRAMQDYCKVISAVIERCEPPQVQPSQFDSGEICIFRTDRRVANKQQTFSVIATVYPQGVSYTLTCY